MKIGIEARWLGRETTGFGKYARSLLQDYSLLQHGHEFDVYLDQPSAGDGCFRDPRFKSIVVSMRPPFYKQVGIPLDILWHRRRFDLFHFLYNAPPLVTPCPFVLTIHDLSYLHVPEMVSLLNRTTVWWQLRLKARKARRIITISENSKRDIVHRLRIPEAKIDVIPEGVEPAFAPAAPKRKEAVARRYRLGHPFFLYVGTYLSHKNLDTLVRAFARLAASRPAPVELVLAGKKGRNSENVERLVGQLGLQDRVRMTGFVADEDLPVLYSLCTAFVYPSRYEGFGLPLLEAMACGAPVLAANSSCLPEVGGQAAVYFATDGVGELSSLLLRILTEDHFRFELSRRGLARAAQFTWRATAEKTLAVYERARRWNDPLVQQA